eukprot:Rhum_TRINITY_DN18639_c0_g1::Rhum_TRINITY_DN18639_c0_g1_i1::g.168087::m.168087/K07874/RAB1A; Ras-related protein Rab-1A
MTATVRMSDFDVLLKTIVIGDAGVGKSSFLHRYTEGDFNPTYIATIGVDFKIDTFEQEGKVVKLQLWDTAGQERFRTIAAAYYRGAHCVIMCYDTTSLESFESLRGWMREVDTYARDNVPVVLVGTKSDLKAQKEVPTQMAAEYAAAHGMAHLETSAKDGTNVRDVVREAVSEALEKRFEVLEAETDQRRKRMLRYYPEEVTPRPCFQRLRGILGL